MLFPRKRKANFRRAYDPHWWRPFAGATVVGLLALVFVFQLNNILDWLDVWPLDQELQAITWDGTEASLAKMCIRGCGSDFSFAIIDGQRLPTFGENNGGCRNFWLPKGVVTYAWFGKNAAHPSVVYGPERARGLCTGIFAPASEGPLLEYVQEHPEALKKVMPLLR